MSGKSEFRVYDSHPVRSITFECGCRASFDFIRGERRHYCSCGNTYLVMATRSSPEYGVATLSKRGNAS